MKKIACVVLFSLALDAICQEVKIEPRNNPPAQNYLFDIPTCPGMKLFKNGDSQLNPPFATILRVYKTKDGSPYNKENVISFYRDYYGKRGWKNSVQARIGDEPYLALSVSVHDPNGEDSKIMVSGDLQIWFSPQDGMLTLYMKQWRVSSLTQPAQRKYWRTLKKLETLADEMNYSARQPSMHGRWLKYFPNENLVKHTVYSMNKKSDSSPHGQDTIEIDFLAYKNSRAAEKQARIISSEKQYSYGPRYKMVQIGNILVKINYPGAEESAAEKLTEHFRTLGNE